MNAKHFIRTACVLSVTLWTLFTAQDVHAQNLVRLEYFFDTDPGTGNGTQVVLPAPADSVNFNNTINIGSLVPGPHILFIRARQSNGKWSLYEQRDIFVKGGPVAAEYFIDNDPGPGLGLPLPVIAGPDSSQVVTSIPTTGMPSGPHVLFVRTKDVAGRWSLYEQKPFFIKQPMVTAEYFFDTDPGTGNGTPLPVSAFSDSTVVSSSISTSGLQAGNHILFVRMKDASGRWSHYQQRDVHVLKSIVAAEYFIDADPGLGNAIPLPVGSAANQVNFNAAIPVGALAFGPHFLFVRTKDASGVWSLFEPQQFNIGSPLPVQWLSFDAIGHDEDALLTWETGSEINCDGFEVERMTATSGDFVKIGEVKGSGNTTEKHTYYFTDEKASEYGTVYYRVKQVDFDGAFTYSHVEIVTFENKPVYRLFPNPSSSEFTFDTNGSDAVESVEVFNANGDRVSLVTRLEFPYRFGMELKPGAYFVKIRLRDDVLQFKVLKVG